jgi:DNA-binding HxlR family transcriptional regulator
VGTRDQGLYSATQSVYTGWMLGRSYDNLNCSVARALEAIGERWTILILRDAFLGVRRFDDFQKDLGIARNVLQTRLEHLVDDGIMERSPYQDRPVRYEYRLTQKGLDLWPIIVAMLGWGDTYAAPDGPPLRITHRGDCGGAVTDRGICSVCGAVLNAREVSAERAQPMHTAAAAA